jgi:hypothetical protein
MDTEKAMKFASWNDLEGDGGDAAAFQLAKELEFNGLYNEGMIDPVETMIELDFQPDCCDEATQ